MHDFMRDEVAKHEIGRENEAPIDKFPCDEQLPHFVRWSIT